MDHISSKNLVNCQATVTKRGRTGKSALKLRKKSNVSKDHPDDHKRAAVSKAEQSLSALKEFLQTTTHVKELCQIDWQVRNVQSLPNGKTFNSSPAIEVMFLEANEKITSGDENLDELFLGRGGQNPGLNLAASCKLVHDLVQAQASLGSDRVRLLIGPSLRTLKDNYRAAVRVPRPRQAVSDGTPATGDESFSSASIDPTQPVNTSRTSSVVSYHSTGVSTDDQSDAVSQLDALFDQMILQICNLKTRSAALERRNEGLDAIIQKKNADFEDKLRKALEEYIQQHDNLHICDLQARNTAFKRQVASLEANIQKKDAGFEDNLRKAIKESIQKQHQHWNQKQQPLSPVKAIPSACAPGGKGDQQHPSLFGVFQNSKPSMSGNSRNATAAKLSSSVPLVIDLLPPVDRPAFGVVLMAANKQKLPKVSANDHRTRQARLDNVTKELAALVATTGSKFCYQLDTWECPNNSAVHGHIVKAASKKVSSSLKHEQFRDAFAIARKYRYSPVAATWWVHCLTN